MSSATSSASLSLLENKYILPTHTIIKKFISVSAATSGVIGIQYPSLLLPASYYISSYLFLDLFFTSGDMLLHHLLSLSYFAALRLHEYPEEYKYFFISQVVKFEYSTIIYGGGPLVLHYLSSSKGEIVKWVPFVRNTLQICFAILFLKYRIYDFSKNIMFCKDTYEQRHFQTNAAFFHLIGTTWIFYGLNIYWLQLILWKMIPSDTKTNKNKTV